MSKFLVCFIDTVFRFIDFICIFVYLFCIILIFFKYYIFCVSGFLLQKLVSSLHHTKHQLNRGLVLVHHLSQLLTLVMLHILVINPIGYLESLPLMLVIFAVLLILISFVLFYFILIFQDRLGKALLLLNTGSLNNS